jgi:hypothetical protein
MAATVFQLSVVRTRSTGTFTKPIAIPSEYTRVFLFLTQVPAGRGATWG